MCTKNSEHHIFNIKSGQEIFSFDTGEVQINTYFLRGNFLILEIDGGKLQFWHIPRKSFIKEVQLNLPEHLKRYKIHYLNFDDKCFFVSYTTVLEDGYVSIPITDQDGQISRRIGQFRNEENRPGSSCLIKSSFKFYPNSESSSSSSSVTLE